MVFTLPGRVMPPQHIRKMPISATIIVPCYNESSRLDVPEYTNFLLKYQEIHFIFVNDGSQDHTLDYLQRIKDKAPGQTTIISLPANRGKAEAVRQGVLTALKTPTKFIGYWDADLATKLDEILVFAALLDNSKNWRIICGARIKRLGTNIERRWYRHYSGRIIATLVSMILQLPTYDTQCGAKLFDRDLAEIIFSKPLLSSWLFDVELIARIIACMGKSKAATMIYEHPLSAWRDIGNSKISLCYLPKIPFELARIYLHYYKQLK